MQLTEQQAGRLANRVYDQLDRGEITRRTALAELENLSTWLSFTQESRLSDLQAACLHNPWMLDQCR